MYIKKLIRITTVPMSLKILLKDQLKYMNQYFEVVGVSSKGKELADVEKDEGIRTIELDMSREITPVKDFIPLIKMIILLLKEKPNIVHVQQNTKNRISCISFMKVTLFKYRYDFFSLLKQIESGFLISLSLQI